jgi:hypothetical protein
MRSDRAADPVPHDERHLGPEWGFVAVEAMQADQCPVAAAVVLRPPVVDGVVLDVHLAPGRQIQADDQYVSPHAPPLLIDAYKPRHQSAVVASISSTHRRSCLATGQRRIQRVNGDATSSEGRRW